MLKQLCANRCVIKTESSIWRACIAYRDHSTARRLEDPGAIGLGREVEGSDRHYSRRFYYHNQCRWWPFTDRPSPDEVKEEKSDLVGSEDQDWLDDREEEPLRRLQKFFKSLDTHERIRRKLTIAVRHHWNDEKSPNKKKVTKKLAKVVFAH